MNEKQEITSDQSTRVDISVIIINWNSVNFLRACLASLQRQSRRPKEVIVIDNASFDGVADMLREEHPDVMFLQSRENLGFSKANNVAAKHATGSLLLFLNPDTEVPAKGIEALHDAAVEIGEFGVLGPVLLNSDGSLQLSAAQAFPTILNQVLDSEHLRRRFPRLRIWGMKPFLDETRSRAECISGACMLMTAKLFWELQGFSEKYFMYSEDVDLSFRAAKAGRHNYIIPEVRVLHHGGGSSSKRPNTFAVTTMRESRFRFFAANRSVFYAQCFKISIGASALLRLLALTFARSSARTDGARRLKLENACIKWKAVLVWALTCRVDGK